MSEKRKLLHNVFDELYLELGFRSMMAAAFSDPDSISIEQEICMRRAWFGGAKTALDFLDHGVRQEELRNELAIYIQAVKDGVDEVFTFEFPNEPESSKKEG